MRSAVHAECSACGVQCVRSAVHAVCSARAVCDRFIAIMSDGAAPVCCFHIDSSVSLYTGVWENVAAAHIAKHVVLADSLASAAKEIVKDAGEQSVAADRGCV